MAIKRVLCVILSLVILTGCLMVGTWAETEVDPETDSVKTVYVSGKGNDENDGSTTATPVNSLNDAIEARKKAEESVFAEFLESHK